MPRRNSESLVKRTGSLHHAAACLQDRELFTAILRSIVLRIRFTASRTCTRVFPRSKGDNSVCAWRLDKVFLRMAEVFG